MFPKRAYKKIVNLFFPRTTVGQARYDSPIIENYCDYRTALVVISMANTNKCIYKQIKPLRCYLGFPNHGVFVIARDAFAKHEA